jgi:methionine synthase II (cobalamin-independent)
MTGKIEWAMAWNCAPTCIGSLPFTDPVKAVDVVMDRLREIPYWPQLPARGFQENMYAQFATHLPGVVIDRDNKKVTVDLGNYDPEDFYNRIINEDVDSFAYAEDSFSGFFEMMKRQLPKGAKAVKGQVIGPVSAGLQIVDQNGRPSIYDEAYGEIIRRNLNMAVRWQERQLSKMSDQVIIFLDEPSLSLIGTPFASVSSENVISWIDEVFEGVKATRGLHCCGNTDWPMVLSTSVDLLSFDAYSYAFSVSLYPEQLKAFLERGGTLSWGLIPNMDHRLEKETVGTLVQRFDSSVNELVAKGLSRDMLLEQSLITPECGLGGLSEAESLHVLDLLVQVSEAIRSEHGLEG